MDGFDHGNRVQAKLDFLEANAAGAHAAGLDLEPGAAHAVARLVEFGAGYPLVPPSKNYVSATYVTLLHHLQYRLERAGALPPPSKSDGGGGLVPIDEH